MVKRQNHAGLNKIFAKYKTLRNEEENLLEREYLAKQAYDAARRISKNKADECAKVIEAIELLYGINKEERHRLWDSPTNILVSCEMASNPFFLNRIDEEILVGEEEKKISFNKKTIENLQYKKIFYIGDLVQKTSEYLYEECERYGKAQKGVVQEVRTFLKELNLHLGIKITDWVSPPKQE